MDYAIVHPKMATEEIRKAVQTLAEDMGVKLHPLKDIGDETEYPVITSSIKLRDMLMGEGYDAAHILELMFGMGECNTHLIHEHDHGHGDEEAEDRAEERIEAKAEPAPLPDEAKQKANRQELRELLLQLYWNE